MCLRICNRLAHRFGFVAAEIVEDDDIAGTQSGSQELLDIAAENLSVDRAVDDTGLRQGIDAQCSQESECAPAPVWCKTLQTFAARCPAAQRRHVRLDPGLVDKDKTFRGDMALNAFPTSTPNNDITTVLLVRE